MVACYTYHRLTYLPAAKKTPTHKTRATQKAYRQKKKKFKEICGKSAGDWDKSRKKTT